MDAAGRAHKRGEDGVGGEHRGLVLLSQAADDRVVGGGDLEEVARLEALEAACGLGVDAIEGAVVVLDGAAQEEVLGLVGDGEGELGKVGEGDLLTHGPVGLDVDGGLGRRGLVAAEAGVVVGAVVLEVALAAGALLLGLAAARLHLLVAALRELRTLVEAPLGAEPRVARRRLGVDEAERGVLRGGGEESSTEVKSKTESREAAARAAGPAGLRVQSAIRPSLSEREKGAKGMEAAAAPPPRDAGAGAVSGGPQPSGLKATTPTSKPMVLGGGGGLDPGGGWGWRREGLGGGREEEWGI